MQNCGVASGDLLNPSAMPTQQFSILHSPFSIQKRGFLFLSVYGMMSFGFKDDGTAFIGSHTAGQLQFDGNTSTITSASYRDRSASGMFLDFDKPEIILRQYGTETIPASSSEQKIYEPYDSYANYEYWRSSVLVKTAYGSI